jgi:uncharacterized protein (TIGR02270 family)
MSLASQVLWDVVEEHLDEAAFLWTQWERALHSPFFKLQALRDRVEERLLAHLDGLVVGGDPVAQRLLIPALSEGLGGASFAATMALLLSDRAAADEAVFGALAAAASPQLEEMVRALSLCPSSERQTRLRGLLSSESGGVRAAAAQILGFQQVDLGPALLGLFQGSDRQAWLAGLYCLRYQPRRDCEAAIVSALRSADAEIVEAGLLAAAVAQLPGLLECCRELLGASHPATPTAALLLTFLGTESDHTLLLQEVTNKRHSKGIIFALGLCGGRDAMAACVEWLHDDQLALAASESFVSLTGVDAEKEKLLAPIPPPPPEEELPDGNADLDLPSEAEIPLLDPLATAAFWESHRNQYKMSERYFQGQAVLRTDPSAWQAALSQANLRQRHPLALGLACVSGGSVIIQTTALANDSADKRQRSSAISVAKQPGSRPF